jgi:hypothetical protein
MSGTINLVNPLEKSFWECLTSVIKDSLIKIKQKLDFGIFTGALSPGSGLVSLVLSPFLAL